MVHDDNDCDGGDDDDDDNNTDDDHGPDNELYDGDDIYCDTEQMNKQNGRGERNYLIK